MVNIVLGFLTSFAIVVVATPALIKVAFLKNLVDVPNEERKTHKRKIPTIGGIIIFAGTLISALLWYPIAEFADFKFIVAAAIILFFIGIKDDIVGTAATKKLVGHLIVAFILVVIAGIKITSLYGIFGVREIPDWASILLSVFTYTVIVNGFNLIDGIDGLAAGVGLIACTAFGLWFYNANSIENGILAFALAGALAGFLIFNFEPAKIFMGDSGSLTIGLIISILSIKMIEYDTAHLPPELIHISKPILAMTILTYPLIDTLRVFTIRILKGQSPFSADRNHIHHNLLDLGLRHWQAVGIIYGFTILAIFLTILLRLHSTLMLFVLSIVAILFSQIPVIIKRILQKP